MSQEPKLENKLEKLESKVLLKNNELVLDEVVSNVNKEYARYYLLYGNVEEYVEKDYKKEDPNLAYFINRRVIIKPVSELVVVKYVWRHEPFRHVYSDLFIYIKGTWYVEHCS